MDRCRQCMVAFLICLVITFYHFQQKLVSSILTPLLIKPTLSSNNLTWVEMLPYFSWRNASACKIFNEFGGVISHIPFLAFLDGQKSVCLDPGVSPMPDRCVVYSFGNNGEWSFDEQIESYGCDVYVFDPSVWWVSAYLYLLVDL